MSFLFNNYITDEMEDIIRTQQNDEEALLNIALKYENVDDYHLIYVLNLNNPSSGKDQETQICDQSVSIINTSKGNYNPNKFFTEEYNNELMEYSNKNSNVNDNDDDFFTTTINKSISEYDDNNNDDEEINIVKIEEIKTFEEINNNNNNCSQEEYLFQQQLEVYEKNVDFVTFSHNKHNLTSFIDLIIPFAVDNLQNIMTDFKIDDCGYMLIQIIVAKIDFKFLLSYRHEKKLKSINNKTLNSSCCEFIIRVDDPKHYLNLVHNKNLKLVSLYLID